MIISRSDIRGMSNISDKICRENQITHLCSVPKIMIYWKPEGRKKRGRPRRTWKDAIYTAMNGRDVRMDEWNNRRQWNMKVGRRRQTL